MCFRNKLLALLLLAASSVSAQDVGRIPFYTTYFHGSAGSFSAHTMDSNDDSVEIIHTASEAFDVDEVCFGVGSETGAPGTWIVGLETVTATTGRASGVVKTGTGNCTGTFTPNGATAGAETCVALTGTTCAVARGETFATTVKYSSGTVNGSNYWTMRWRHSGASDQDNSRAFTPWAWTVANGAATRQSDEIALIKWKNATTTYGTLIKDAFNAISNTVCSDSTADEVGNYFTYSCCTGGTYKIAALDAFVKTGATGKTITATIYDGTTDRQSFTIDSDYLRANSVNTTERFPFDDSTLYSLSCGTPYTLALKANETSCDFIVYLLEFYNANDQQGWPFGTNTYLRTRADAGAWTSVTTQRAMIHPVIDSITCPAAGSTGPKGLNQFSGGMQ